MTVTVTGVNRIPGHRFSSGRRSVVAVAVTVAAGPRQRRDRPGGSRQEPASVTRTGCPDIIASAVKEFSGPQSASRSRARRTARIITTRAFLDNTAAAECPVPSPRPAPHCRRPHRPSEIAVLAAVRASPSLGPPPRRTAEPRQRRLGLPIAAQCRPGSSLRLWMRAALAGPRHRDPRASTPDSDAQRHRTRTRSGAGLGRYPKGR